MSLPSTNGRPSLPEKRSGRQSAEAGRMALLVIVAVLAAGLSGFYAVKLDGFSIPRLALTAMAGGWVVVLMLAFSQMPRPSRR
jgi:hypothetical protein